MHDSISSRRSVGVFCGADAPDLLLDPGLRLGIEFARIAPGALDLT
jgi:hypothetical protein